MCGVYYLWDGAEVLYVGSSKRIEGRISYHRKRGIDFAGYFVDECKPSELMRRESEAIAEFKPKFNEAMVLQP